MAVWLSLKGMSSNKPEEGKSEKKSKKGNILYKNISYCPISGRVAVLKPVIDKVSLTYKLDDSDPTLKPAVIESLLQEAEEKGHFKSAGQFQSGAVKYAASVKLVVPPDGEEVLVQAGPKKPGLKHDLLSNLIQRGSVPQASPKIWAAWGDALAKSGLIQA
jgi:hypothetical protein